MSTPSTSTTADDCQKQNEEGDNMNVIGERNTFAVWSLWKNQPLLHIRRYARDDEQKKMYPTRKGIALNEKEFYALLDAQPQLKKQLKKLKKQYKVD